MEGLGFSEFLNWILYGGGATMAMSWLLERWGWFQIQSVKMKQFITYSASAVFGMMAYAMVTFGSELIAKVEPFFMILSSVFVMIFINNAFHKGDKK